MSLFLFNEYELFSSLCTVFLMQICRFLQHGMNKCLLFYCIVNAPLLSPLQYLLHYLVSVKSLVNRHAWSRTPVAETSWALLRDCYHGDMCIRHTPQHLAIAALYLALNTYGVEVPLGEKEWWQVGVSTPGLDVKWDIETDRREPSASWDIPKFSQQNSLL